METNLNLANNNTTTILTQQVLDDLILNLKSKYKNILYDLRLECRPINVQDNNDDANVRHINSCGYITLVFIGIKKSQRQKGYGSLVLSEVITLADKYNVPIKLWVTDVFGIELNVLIAFYQRHGFTLVKYEKTNVMYYFPK